MINEKQKEREDDFSLSEYFKPLPKDVKILLMVVGIIIVVLCDLAIVQLVDWSSAFEVIENLIGLVTNYAILRLLGFNFSRRAFKKLAEIVIGVTYLLFIGIIMELSYPKLFNFEGDSMIEEVAPLFIGLKENLLEIIRRERIEGLMEGLVIITLLFTVYRVIVILLTRSTEFIKYKSLTLRTIDWVVGFVAGGPIGVICILMVINVGNQIFEGMGGFKETTNTLPERLFWELVSLVIIILFFSFVTGQIKRIEPKKEKLLIN